MKIKYEYGGANDEARGLRIYVEIKAGGSRRLTSVLVPWDEFTSVNRLHQIDQAVRARLVAAWEPLEALDQRLPGID